MEHDSCCPNGCCPNCAMPATLLSPLLPPAHSQPGESGANCSNLMDCMILDGSFVGGKGFYSHSSYENDADNPAFNVYGGALAADQALLIAQV